MSELALANDDTATLLVGLEQVLPWNSYEKF